MEEPNVERLLEEMARHKEIDLPTDRRQWIVHVSHENLVPVRHMGLLRRLRFRLFMFLRLISQPTYYYYGLGDEVHLSVENNRCAGAVDKSMSPVGRRVGCRNAKFGSDQMHSGHGLAQV